MIYEDFAMNHITDELNRNVNAERLIMETNRWVIYQQIPAVLD